MCSAILDGWHTRAHIYVWTISVKTSIFFYAIACNFAVIFRCIYAPFDDHYNFLSPELDGQSPLYWARWSVKQPSILQSKLNWSGKKYLLTVMKNVGQFSRSIGSSGFNLFFNLFFDDNFCGFWMVNNFKTLHIYLRSLK